MPDLTESRTYDGPSLDGTVQVLGRAVPFRRGEPSLVSPEEADVLDLLPEWGGVEDVMVAVEHPADSTLSPTIEGDGSVETPGPAGGSASPELRTAPARKKKSVADKAENQESTS